MKRMPRINPRHSRVNPLRQQNCDCLAIQAGEKAVVLINNGFGQAAFGFLEFENLFFHRVFCDQTVRKNALRLTDAMGAVDGLGFDGRIPPWIEQEHVLGRRQIQSQSAGFQADQENRAGLIVLEPAYAGLTVSSFPVEVFIH